MEQAAAGGASAATIRSLTATVYVPSLLFAIGQGAVIPIVALSAREVGASVAVAGVAVGLRGIGTMVTDIPAGTLVARVGERKAMSVGTGVLIASLVGAIASSSPLQLAASMFLMGAGWSVWLLARLTYVSEVMPVGLRGRALSTLGGVHRIGNFIGPLAGAVAVTWMGVDGAYVLHLVVGAAGWAVLLLIPDPVKTVPPEPHPAAALRAVVRDHRRILVTAGFGAMMISVLRASRHAVIPLWGAHVGLDAPAVALIFGISSGMDMLLFYPAGSISDRFGRKRVAVPCLATLAAGFVLLPLAGSFMTVAAVGVLMGFGNGLGSGIVMTLGADFAPAHARAGFLGVWRMVSDVGQAGGPLLAAGIIGLSSLGTAAVAVGALGLAGAGVMVRFMPETAGRTRLGAGPAVDA